MSLDWKEIEKKYPKSYEHYAFWQNYDKKPEKTFNDRDLYDFFDSLDIRIFIKANPISSRLNDCVYKIINYTLTEKMAAGFGGFKVTEVKGPWKLNSDRKSTEEKAFMKAFSILEKKLKKKFYITLISDAKKNNGMK